MDYVHTKANAHVIMIASKEVFSLMDLKKPERRFRPEIEGVRTVATLLVAIYHIWLGRVSGGIDVFFIISGFLITTSLLSRLERKGAIDYGDFMLGLARRLFPQALFVVGFIMSISLVILPKVEWGNLHTHMIASVFYFENWRLALDSVDYLARDQSASPFQHYWSLGVQMQFYILWMFLFSFLYVIAKKWLKLPLRKTVLFVLLLLFTVSLTYSIVKTSANQPWAYFDTFARMWEFSIGGMLALLLPYLRFTKKVVVPIGWIGLLIICTTGIVLPVSTVFPGYLALVPISGVIFIIIASNTETKWGVDRFLGFQPFQALGSLTYGIYLWHWPLLIFYQQYTGAMKVPLIHGVILLSVSIFLSYLSTNFLEKPMMKMDIRVMKKQVVSVLTIMLLGIGMIGGGSYYYIESVKAQTIELDEGREDYPGALAVYYDLEVKEGVEPIPSALDIKMDLPAFYSHQECLGKDGVEVKKCSYGSLENPDYIVALVGGSHSGHWFPALEILAEELNFQIDLYNHDGCRFTNEDPGNQLTDTCLEWNENLIETLKVERPDLVFTTSTITNRDFVLDGYIAQWKALEGYTTIFGVRDNPRLVEDAPSCVEREENPLDCGIPRDEGVSKKIPWEGDDNIPSNVIFADLTDYFCNETICPPVIGNIIVYRDNNHITAEYAKTLAVPLRDHLAEALKQLEK